MSESIGSYLKRERELRKISLAEISEHTHIKMGYLEAMESEHFEKIPGITFVRGYLSAYSRYLGLLPEDVLLRFEDYLEKLSGAPKDFQKTNSRLFWLNTFLVLAITAAVIMIWFRK